jgi:hypothetical protein
MTQAVKRNQPTTGSAIHEAFPAGNPSGSLPPLSAPVRPRGTGVSKGEAALPWDAIRVRRRSERRRAAAPIPIDSRGENR